MSQNSQNSHLPPSKDSVKAKNSRRKSTGAKVGGQQKHNGNTLETFKEVTEIIECPVLQCECGCDLRKADGEVCEIRQMVEIPKVTFDVIEYQRIEKQCPHCNAIVRGHFPPNITAPIQYGPRLQSYVVGLNNEYKLPFGKISELTEQLFGLKVNVSTIVNCNKRGYVLLEEFETSLKKYLIKSNVLHADETGIIVDTLLYWMHVLSNDKATYLKVDKKRGSQSFEETLLSYTGHLMHDSYSSYNKLTNAQHNFCGSHIDRELESLMEDGSEWASKMKKLFVDLYETAYEHNNAKKMSIYARYNRIIREGLNEEPVPERKGKRGRSKNSKGYNLLLRLKKHKDSILEYAFNPLVPFTNNQAERDLRHCKIKQKVSGCFRSLKGALYYSRIASFISTLKKNSINIFDELAKLFSFEPLSLKLT